jgi:hypothetical protein
MGQEQSAKSKALRAKSSGGQLRHLNGPRQIEAGAYLFALTSLLFALTSLPFALRYPIMRSKLSSIDSGEK